MAKAIATKKRGAVGPKLTKIQPKGDLLLQQEQQQKSAVVGDFLPNIKLDNGEFLIDGESMGDTMDVIIIAYTHENRYYIDQFVEGENAPPDCFALSMLPTEMVPHEKSGEKQEDTCDGCTYSAFGSSDNGKGKRCQNRVRLGVIPAADAKNIETAEVMSLNIPPTSLKAFNTYVTSLRNLDTMISFVVTRLTGTRVAKYTTVDFELQKQWVTQAIVNKGTLEKRIEEVYEDLLRPYEAVVDEAPKKPAKKRAAPKKRAKKTKLN